MTDPIILPKEQKGNYDLSKIAWAEVHAKTGEVAFMCFDCYFISFHLMDLKKHYCGNCHEFK